MPAEETNEILEARRPEPTPPDPYYNLDTTDVPYIHAYCVEQLAPEIVISGVSGKSPIFFTEPVAATVETWGQTDAARWVLDMTAGGNQLYGRTPELEAMLREWIQSEGARLMLQNIVRNWMSLDTWRRDFPAEWVEDARPMVMLRVKEGPPPWEWSPAPTLPAPPRGRRGKRLMAQLPELFRIPTAEPVKDSLSILARGHFQLIDGDSAIMGLDNNGSQVRIECDDSTFGPDRAIQVLARKGPSIVQRFIAIAGLWLVQMKGKQYDTYLTASATDVLRFMGRKPTNRGGYRMDDIYSCGYDLAILQRTSVPRVHKMQYSGNSRKGKTVHLSISHLAMIETLDAHLTLDPEDPSAIILFKYHLGREVYDSLCGGSPQYALASGKLLTYHPERQKYQILLGFALIHHDRVNEKHKRKELEITLPALLNLAAIDVPKRNVPEFLNGIVSAVQELSNDGVVPGAQLALPDAREAAKLSARKVIGEAKVTFPALRDLHDARARLDAPPPALPEGESEAALAPRLAPAGGTRE